jgi:predicted alpha/beta-hydrolase family hydrolase
MRGTCAPLGGPRPVFIGGKSMGGRIASMLADDLHDEGLVAGLVCLGYPFHPPGRPQNLRTAHLEHLRAPALICQGERDTFGNREEVGGYPLSPAITIHWAPDGDHSLKPRVKSGHTWEENIHNAARAIADFIREPA